MIHEIITPDTPKHEVFNIYTRLLKTYNLEVALIDDKRPWGGFIQLKESQAVPFTDKFFNETRYGDLKNVEAPLTPKILIIAPGKKLSWQYHHRRAEIWKILLGPVGVILSKSDILTDLKVFVTGSIIEIESQQRHRLVGLDNWGIVAELWKHTDLTNISTENDIIRLQDDYGR